MKYGFVDAFKIGLGLGCAAVLTLVVVTAAELAIASLIVL